jgi:hypothetical protein
MALRTAVGYKYCSNFIFYERINLGWVARCLEFEMMDENGRGGRTMAFEGLNLILSDALKVGYYCYLRQWPQHAIVLTLALGRA